jgi:hypothetical protein
VRRVTLLLLCACASQRLTLEDAQECPSFVEVDARARRELDQLLASAPGELLVKEASRLNVARRACARHRLGVLRELREREGLEAVEQELEALTVTYSAADLRLLLVEHFGPEAEQLEPLLAEARQRHERRLRSGQDERTDAAARARLAVDEPPREGAEPRAPETLCDAPTPCEQLRCVAAEGGPVDGPARACLDSLPKSDPLREARGVSEVLGLLPPGVSGTRTEASLRLESLKTELWPSVARETAAGHPARAAELATPFAVSPRGAEQVAQLRDAAQAHHLGRAKALAGWPDARWLHLALVQQFGGPAVDVPAREGKWDSVRWRCPGEAPALPALPVGVSATFSVRCDRAEGGAEPSSERSDFMRTFELEKSMSQRQLMGALRVSCADRTSSYAVYAADLEGLPSEVGRTLAVAVDACTQQHALAATRSCTELRKRTPGELTARFVEHARFLQKWEPCFVEWLLAEEGATPPRPPPPPRR